MFNIENPDEFFKKREESLEGREKARKRITTDLFIGTKMEDLY